MNFKLLTAGPVKIPHIIQQEIGKPILYHRDPEFITIYQEVISGIQYLLQTKNDVLIFTGSGTAGMEAVVVNLFSKGDRVLVIEQGKFSARWSEICTNYGLYVDKIELEWQDSITEEQILQVLTAKSEIKAVFLVHCETSTGALNDVEVISKIIHESSDALVIVDAISGIGVIPFKMDDWAIEVAIISSNKGLMNPPGLVFVALNSKAWEFALQSNLPKYYFDFGKARDAFNSGIGSPFTPAITLIRGVHRALYEIRRKGLNNLWDYHHSIAQAFRAAILSMGLEIWSHHPSDSLTVIYVPPPLEANQIINILKEKNHIIISRGQGKLQNKVLRIAHIGKINLKDLEEIISALESILNEMGWHLQLGIGLKTFHNNLS